mgnify:CR=1 FL=1
MPEIYDSNPRTKSKYDGEAVRNKKYAKLGARITDNVPHKLFGLKTTDEEYWGLREILTEPEVDVALTMKQRKWYTYDQLLETNRKNMDAETFKKTLDLLCVHGFVEYDYGDHYDDNGPIPGAPKELRYRTSYFVPGSAELFNSSVDRIEKNPPVAKMFERMTFLPLEHITSMVRPGGNGIGMHVIPVEKEVAAERTAVDIEKISYWLQKYDGHLSAGICSCRASRAMLGEGCTDDVNDWCIQVGDMADYTVETGRAHYITKEEALDILRKAEENGYVHQVTNIDGADHIFDICNCNVQICNALRTSLLYNTPNMSKSAYTARVDKEKCVACGRCVEFCPAGALKLGQKLCQKDGKPVEYPKSVLPDRIRWGKYAWDENYRDTARVNTHKTGSAPCKAACPAHVSIQGYLKMAREGRYDEALALIKRENPFPAICGRVCNKRCEDACTRGTVDAPVAIDDVKKFLAERDLHAETRYVPKKIVNNLTGDWPQKIAIIGGGPAGLSCAYYLAERGYKPTVFEKNSKPGGMMTYGIPSYKLEKDVNKPALNQNSAFAGLMGYNATLQQNDATADLPAYDTSSGYVYDETSDPVMLSPTLKNYVTAFTNNNVNILRGYKNSLIISGTVMAAVMLLSTMMAFALTRWKFRGQELVKSLVVAALMFPAFSTIVPVYRMITRIGLFDTLASVIIVQTAGNLAFACTVMMGFVTALPYELEEAAFMEGCGVYDIFWRIVLPMCRPALATVAIFTFIWSYNDLFVQMVLLRSKALMPVCAILREISSQYGTDYGFMAAAVAIVVIPVMILYLFLQKNIIKGLTAGAVKG